jgi:hypothetical protein
LEPLFCRVLRPDRSWTTTSSSSPSGIEAVAEAKRLFTSGFDAADAEQGSLHGLEEILEGYPQPLCNRTRNFTEGAHPHAGRFPNSTDNAVSKTVNFANDATVQDVARVYELAYKLDCKGVTIYRDGSRDQQVLSKGKKEEQAPDAGTDHEKTLIKRERPKVLQGWTYQMQTGCGPLYVTVNEDSTGLFELFTTMGKAGGCAASQNEAIGRMVSLAWRSGLQARQVLNSSGGSPAIPLPVSAKTRSFPVQTPSPKPFSPTWPPTAARCRARSALFSRAPVRSAAGLSNTKGDASSAGSAATASARKGGTVAKSGPCVWGAEIA